MRGGYGYENRAMERPPKAIIVVCLDSFIGLYRANINPVYIIQFCIRQSGFYFQS